MKGDRLLTLMFALMVLDEACRVRDEGEARGRSSSAWRLPRTDLLFTLAPTPEDVGVKLGSPGGLENPDRVEGVVVALIIPGCLSRAPTVGLLGPPPWPPTSALITLGLLPTTPRSPTALGVGLVTGDEGSGLILARALGKVGVVSDRAEVPGEDLKAFVDAEARRVAYGRNWERPEDVGLEVEVGPVTA